MRVAEAHILAWRGFWRGCGSAQGGGREEESADCARDLRSLIPLDGPAAPAAAAYSPSHSFIHQSIAPPGDRATPCCPGRGGGGRQSHMGQGWAAVSWAVAGGGGGAERGRGGDRVMMRVCGGGGCVGGRVRCVRCVRCVRAGWRERGGGWSAFLRAHTYLQGGALVVLDRRVSSGEEWRLYFCRKKRT